MENIKNLIADGKLTLSDIRYNKSFKARFIQSSEEIKKFYTKIKNHIMGYKNILYNSNWENDSIVFGGNILSKITVKGKFLYIFLALNEREIKKLKIEEISKNKKMKDIPALIKVDDEQKCKKALKAITVLFERYGIEFIEDEKKDYNLPYQTREELLQRRLITITVRGREKFKRVVGEEFDDSRVSGKKEKILDKNEEKNIINCEESIDTKEIAENLEIEAIEDTKTIENKQKNVEKMKEVTAIEAENKMTDDIATTILANSKKRYLKIGSKKAIINIDTISNNFKDGDVITINALINKKLVPTKSNYLKVLARGTLNKKITVIANSFSLGAIKMITLTGGEIVRIIRK